MSDITLQEIRKKRSLLEVAMDELINEFREDTGVYPANVIYNPPSIYRAMGSGATQTLKHRPFIDVELRI